MVFAIQRDKADLGLGIRPVAERYGLDFIPVADEHYDFAVRSASHGKQSVRFFLEVLRSREFKQKIERRAPGLTTTKETGAIIHSPKTRLNTS